MSATLQSPVRPLPDFVARSWAWRVAAVAPLVLAVPWLLLGRWVQEPAGLGTLRGLLLVLLLSSATVTDLLWRRIFNWCTYTTLGWVVFLHLLTLVLAPYETIGTDASGSALQVVSALGMLPWRDSLAGFVVGFVLMFVLYNLFRGGAGDLKLVAVLGALLGANRILEVLIYSYILAGIFAACLVIAVVGPAVLLACAVRSVGLGGPAPELRNCLKRQVPMAPFLAGGTLLALVSG